MKKRKLFLGLLVVVMVLSFTITGCGNDAESAAEKEGGDKEEQYVIKMATPSNPEDSCVRAFYDFKEMLEEKTEGRILVEVHDRGQLGSHADYIDSLGMGSIQAAEINTSVLSSIDPSFQVFDLPYISKDMDHQMKVLYEDGLGDILSEKLEKAAGIKIIGWMVRSPRSVYSSKGEIHGVDDFSGLKIRIMESPVMTKTMEYLGAVPVPLSATERYMALQTGVVDAAENSVPLIITEKEYEVTDFLNLTEHFITPNIIAMDVNFFNNLPEDLQKVVEETALEAGKLASKYDKEELDSSLVQLEELGMKITHIEDKTPFVEAVKPLYEEYSDEIGQDILDMFLK
jgi:tripartite ATP-independent transporter DctP family solute receptor